MARITEYLKNQIDDKDLYNVLLAAGEIDGSGGTLYGRTAADGQGIKPNDQDVTILIGLGGTGIRTLDYIKRKVIDRLDFTWDKHIAFLGIDADWNEVNQATCLSKNECIKLDDNQLKNKVQNRHMWPWAWEHIASEDAISGLSNLNLDEPGSCGARLVGKLKIHNKLAANPSGFDQDVVNRITTTIQTAQPGPNGKYRFYVIGSGSGGTCSGTFLELPALIRNATGKRDNVSVCGMLYLPDTLEKRSDINSPDRMKAVGFATLKELDYYTGIIMRKGSKENFAYNGASGTLYQIDLDKFYDISYLVGTRSGASPSSCREATETVAEYLLSMLGDYNVSDGNGNFLAESAISNMGQNAANRECRVDANGSKHILPSEPHNVPKEYSAVGFAEASTPIKLVRAYTVAEACKKAGIRGVSGSELSAITGTLPAGGILPFRGLDCFMTADAGTQIARNMIQPLQDAMSQVVYNGACDLLHPNTCGGTGRVINFSWESVKVDKVYTRDYFNRQLDEIYNHQTSVDAMEKMQQDLRAAFQAFESNVIAHVKQYGPLSFVNLYNGAFISENNNHGMGIKEMIENLVAGKNADGTALDITSVAEAEEATKKALSVIEKARNDLAARAKRAVLGDETGKWVNSWRTKQENLIKAKINEKRGGRATGSDHYLQQYFKIPAEILCTDLRVFGNILNQLSSIYSEHGKPVNKIADFSNACDNACEVNIAALDHNAYSWIKREAQRQLDTVSAMQLRNALVDSFVNNREGWMEIPDGTVSKSSTGQYFLSKHDRAIPARETFDKCMFDTINFTFKLGINDLFEQATQSQAACNAMAQNIIRDLRVKSEPLFNGTKQNNYIHRSIMYPRSLNTPIVLSNGNTINVAQALQTAIQNEFNGVAVNSYPSADTDSIRMYQMVGSLEMYRLNDLADWEMKYEEFLGRARGYDMHGYSPSKVRSTDRNGNLTYTDDRPWRDYPSPVAYAKDPRTTPNSITGKIGREGQRRIEIDKLFHKAKELGVLYPVRTNDGWIINMAVPKQEWHLDLHQLEKYDDGFYPNGKDLMAELMAQHDVDYMDNTVTPAEALEANSKRVYLERTELPYIPANTPELAWEYALHTLYTHIPLLDELARVVPWFENESKVVREENRKLLELDKPAMLPGLMMFDLIRDADDKWLAMVGKQMTQVVNLSPIVVQNLQQKYINMLQNGMRCAYVYLQLMKSPKMSSDAYCALFEMARAQYAQLFELVQSGDEDAINDYTAWIKRADNVVAEAKAAQQDLGAKFGEFKRHEPKSVNSAFRDKLAQMGLDQNEIQSIYDFYRHVLVWKSMIN